jgi:hypothetical protein
MLERVGKAVVSTWLRASVMQYSDVSGGKRDAESVASKRGILLIRNDLRIVADWAFSFLKVALARISKAARIRSTMVDRISP